MNHILLIDEHAIVRAGLKYILREFFSSVSTEEAANANEAIRKILKSTYDLVILDINLPNIDAFSLINRILMHVPSSKILLFSLVSDQSTLKRYIRSGVKGFVNKNSDEADVVAAIRTVLSGNRYLSREIMNLILDEKVSDMQDNPIALLSEREFEITKRLLEGDNLTAIARRLNIHTSTVGTHKSKIFGKLKVSNLVELMSLTRNKKLE
jgi:two-component system invasion response regulator UvrY